MLCPYSSSLGMGVRPVVMGTNLVIISVCEFSDEFLSLIVCQRVGKRVMSFRKEKDFNEKVINFINLFLSTH